MSFTTEQLTLRTEESGRKRAKAHPGGVRNRSSKNTGKKPKRKKEITFGRIPEGLLEPKPPREPYSKYRET